MTLDPATVEALAVQLTEAQRHQILALFPNENRMGGYWPDSGCPGLITNNGINHPVWGAHYRLTPLGIAVRAAIRALTHDGEK